MNITVYLGAKEGNDPALKRAVQELVRFLRLCVHFPHALLRWCMAAPKPG